MYPGGLPIKREIACFSEYSEQSIRMTASGSSKRNFASDLVSSVLPVPLGPPAKLVSIRIEQPAIEAKTHRRGNLRSASLRPPDRTSTA